MVIYNQMEEAWVDTEDPNFKVSMTPEGEKEIYERQFKDQEEFNTWYNS